MALKLSFTSSSLKGLMMASIFFIIVSSLPRRGFYSKTCEAVKVSAGLRPLTHPPSRLHEHTPPSSRLESPPIRRNGDITSPPIARPHVRSRRRPAACEFVHRQQLRCRGPPGTAAPISGTNPSVYLPTSEAVPTG